MICCENKVPRGTWLKVALVGIFGEGSTHQSFIYEVQEAGSGATITAGTYIIVPDYSVVHDSYTTGYVREDDVWAEWNPVTLQPVPRGTVVWADKNKIEVVNGATAYAEWLCASVRAFDSAYVTDISAGENVLVDVRDAIIVSDKGDNQWLFQADSIIARCV